MLTLDILSLPLLSNTAVKVYLEDLSSVNCSGTGTNGNLATKVPRDRCRHKQSPHTHRGISLNAKVKDSMRHTRRILNIHSGSVGIKRLPRMLLKARRTHTVVSMYCPQPQRGGAHTMMTECIGIFGSQGRMDC